MSLKTTVKLELENVTPEQFQELCKLLKTFTDEGAASVERSADEQSAEMTLASLGDSEKKELDRLFQLQSWDDTACSSKDQPRLKRLRRMSELKLVEGILTRHTPEEKISIWRPTQKGRLVWLAGRAKKEAK